MNKKIWNEYLIFIVEERDITSCEEERSTHSREDLI